MWIRKFSSALLQQWDRDEDRTPALDASATGRRLYAVAKPADQAERTRTGFSDRRSSVGSTP